MNMTVRRMLDFLGLPFDPAVLRFYESARNRHISTPSYEAVTRPIYTASLGRWKPYAEVFEKVRDPPSCLLSKPSVMVSGAIPKDNPPVIPLTPHHCWPHGSYLPKADPSSLIAFRKRSPYR